MSMKLKPYNMKPYKSEATTKLDMPHEDKRQNLARRMSETATREMAFNQRKALSKKQQNTAC